MAITKRKYTESFRTKVKDAYTDDWSARTQQSIEERAQAIAISPIEVRKVHRRTPMMKGDYKQIEVFLDGHMSCYPCRKRVDGVVMGLQHLKTSKVFLHCADCFKLLFNSSTLHVGRLN